MEQVYANHKLVYYCYLIVGIIVVGGSGWLGFAVMSQNILNLGNVFSQRSREQSSFVRVCTSKTLLDAGKLIKDQMQSTNLLTQPYKLLCCAVIKECLTVRKNFLSSQEEDDERKRQCDVCKESVLSSDRVVRVWRYSHLHLDCVLSGIMHNEETWYQDGYTAPPALSKAPEMIELLLRMKHDPEGREMEDWPLLGGEQDERHEGLLGGD